MSVKVYTFTQMVSTVQKTKDQVRKDGIGEQRLWYRLINK